MICLFLFYLSNETIVARYFYQNNVQSPCEPKVIDAGCNIIYRLCLQNLWCLQVVSCIYLQTETQHSKNMDKVKELFLQRLSLLWWSFSWWIRVDLHALWVIFVSWAWRDSQQVTQVHSCAFFCLKSKVYSVPWWN